MYVVGVVNDESVQVLRPDEQSHKQAPDPALRHVCLNREMGHDEVVVDGFEAL